MTTQIRQFRCRECGESFKGIGPADDHATDMQLCHQCHDEATITPAELARRISAWSFKPSNSPDWYAEGNRIMRLKWVLTRRTGVAS